MPKNLVCGISSKTTPWLIPKLRGYVIFNCQRARAGFWTCCEGILSSPSHTVIILKSLRFLRWQTKSIKNCKRSCTRLSPNCSDYCIWRSCLCRLFRQAASYGDRMAPCSQRGTEFPTDFVRGHVWIAGMEGHGENA